MWLNSVCLIMSTARSRRQKFLTAGFKLPRQARRTSVVLYYNTNYLAVCLLLLVEVYNCKVGSSDCSQCWGREDQGHLCAWCENSCKPRDDCPPNVGHCPAPEIHKVGPQIKPAGTQGAEDVCALPQLLLPLLSVASRLHKIVNHGVTHMVWRPRALSVHSQLLRERLNRVSLKRFAQ